MTQIKGRASIAYDNPPVITGAASIVGTKEGDGPLGHLFDCIEQDPKFGKNTNNNSCHKFCKLTSRNI